jgi:hypothetical protein
MKRTAIRGHALQDEGAEPWVRSMRVRLPLTPELRLLRTPRTVARRATVAGRPEVVVLCGSTKFYDTFQAMNYDLTMAGKIVLTIGCDTKSDAGLGITAEQKVALDELHKRKIDMADRVLVLNVGGYIGDSTRSEIEYAKWWKKPIDYLVDPT